MNLRPRSSNANRVPTIVVHVDLALISNRHRAIAHIEDIMNVTVYQLHTNEIVFLSAVEEEDAVGLQRFKSKVDVDRLEGLQHCQTDVRVLRLERCDMVGVAGWRIYKTSRQLKSGLWYRIQLRA